MKWEVDVELAQAICGILGAIIVVAAGLYVGRSQRAPEAEPAHSR
jgi:hypothetical protein